MFGHSGSEVGHTKDCQGAVLAGLRVVLMRDRNEANRPSGCCDRRSFSMVACDSAPTRRTAVRMIKSRSCMQCAALRKERAAAMVSEACSSRSSVNLNMASATRCRILLPSKRRASNTRTVVCTHAMLDMAWRVDPCHEFWTTT